MILHMNNNCVVGVAAVFAVVASLSAAPQVQKSVRLEWREGGERPSVVLDFGPECEGGYPAFSAANVKGSPIVRASYATHPDGLGEKGDFWYETRATYLGPSVDLPILPASVNRYDIFSVTKDGRYISPLSQGLVRYVRLTLDKPGAAVTVNGFTLENRGVHAEEPIIGSFDCSDAKLAAIWRMSVRTCELSAIPARTEPLHVVSTLNPARDVWLGPSYAYLADGAKRDRLVWSGDLWWAQRNMYAAYGYDSPYMPGSIKMLAENSTPEGYVQACPYPESHGPLKTGDYGPFASDEFAAWFVPVTWDHILYSGDRALANELYPKAKALVAYLRAHCREDGIFEQRRETSKHASSLDFGEASTYHRAYMNILLWKTYIDAAHLAEWLGDVASAAEWRKEAEKLAASVRRVFWDTAKGRFRGAIEADAYQGEANGLALAVKFCTADEAAAIRKTITYHNHGKFQALFVRGLYEYGYADDAVARIYEHGWDDALDPGWKGARLTSECMHLHTKGWGDEAHPDTAIAGILMNYILGVEPTEPGYAKYRVNPHPSKGVTQASGVVPTPWGKLRVSWRMENGKPVTDCREERYGSQGFVNVADFVTADGKTDVADALQRVIDEHPNRTLWFADGTYLISKPICTPASPKRSIDLQLSNYAILKAAPGWSSAEAMVRLGGIYPANDIRTVGSCYSLTGGIIDGSGVAKGVSIDSGRETKVRGVSMKNVFVGLHIKHGANGNSSDSDISDVNIVGNRKPGSMGVFIESCDNTLSNMRIADVMTGVKLTGSGNLMTNLHPLYTNPMDQYEASVGFQDMGWDNTYNRCYSDHFSTGFLFGEKSAQSVLDACIAFWYAPTKGFRHTAIRCEGQFSAHISDMMIGFRGTEAVNTVLVTGKDGGSGYLRDLRMNKKLVREDDKTYLGYLR